MAVIRSTGYNIVIGRTAFSALNTFLKKKKYSAYFILCDDNTLQRCLPLLITACPELASAEIIEIESGEESKSLELCAQILQTLIDDATDRNALFINLGGGVVSDLGGFTAAIYKRGIDFITIPTSLLSMADASVGGKTGIDFGGIKNSVGSFTQPQAVFIHPDFLNTLSPRHYQNGLAEIYKIALINDKTLWGYLKTAGTKKAETLISKSVALKNAIVLKDPFDKGLRKSLNFGHSVGHAIEALLLGTANELLHGEAIVTGMLIESHVAWQKKLISKAQFTDITAVLTAVFEPKPITMLSHEQVIRAMENDKKNSAGKLHFALPRGIGASIWDVPVSAAQVKKAIDHYNKL